MGHGNLTVSKNYKDKVLDSEKYGLMGVSPKELYLRQNGGCWLELVYDDYGDGEKRLGALYCTDGKDYAETEKMLNPTFECSKCMARFILKQNDKQ